MELSLTTRTVADQQVLEVGGEIDVYTAPKLKERLLELVADGARQIVVDLEAVEFLDSTGLGVLVGGLRRIRARGGHLVLVCTQERILKIFRITGLASFFDIHPSVEAAARVAEPAPDQAAPDQAAPDQAAPDQAAPDQAAPDQPAPGQAAPDQAGQAGRVGQEGHKGPVTGSDEQGSDQPGRAPDDPDDPTGASVPPAPGS